MQSVERGWKWVAAFLLCSCVGLGLAGAQGAPTALPEASPKNILLLYSYGHGGKGIEAFDEGLLASLDRGGVHVNNLFFEYLDLERNRVDPQYGQRLQELLRRKFATHPIDVILTVQQPAQKWLFNEGRDIAPNAPVVTVQAAMPTVAEAGNHQVISELVNFDVKGTLERALELFPETKRVVFVSGSSEVDRQMASAAQRIAEPWAGKLVFEHTADMPLDDMLKHVATLPPHTIIIFTQYNRDVTGKVTVAYEVEGLLAKAANVPVFGLYDFNLKNGGIGGSVISVTRLGEQTGQLLMDLMSGKTQLTQPITRVDVQAIPMFNWPQIQHWDGHWANLPKGSLFVNREPTFFEKYSLYVVGVTLFVAAQTALIFSLLVSRRRRRLAEQSLHESESKYRVLIEHAPDGIAVYDMDVGRFIDCNIAAQQLFGCSREEILKGGPQRFYPIEQFNGRSADDVIAESIQKVMDGEQVNFERTIRDALGKVSICEARLVMLPASGRRLVRISFTDITQRKRSEKALRIAATAFESQLSMAITDAERAILQVNKAFTDVTGYTVQEVTGQNPRFLASGRHDRGFYEAMWHRINQSGSWQGEIWNRRKSGEVFPAWLTITAVKNDAGLATHYVSTFNDITTRKSAEDEIMNLAFYDPLTKLPNRRLLMDRLVQTLATGTRHDRKAALLFVDLDNFKTLNDTLGHANGDLLLEQVAHKLCACVRDGDTVARLGGDEFVVMLEDLSEDLLEAVTQAEVIGKKLLETLGQTYMLADQEYHSTASIGVTLLGEQQEDVDEPLKRADLAMYQAKAAGKNTLRFFDPQMQAVVSARAALESDLRLAVEKEQFVLYYQAQVSCDQQIIGVEALIRWQHPLRGLVPPSDFIPLAEDCGLIVPMGHWVLRTACKQLTAWAANLATEKFTIAVNVSPRQFRQDDFVDQVWEVIQDTGANPLRLKLELTEGLLIENVESVIAKMTELKERGVGFSLDDFGTGYSSLTYLKRLPFDQLKIDQGFVKDILTDPNDSAIAKMIIALADSLGLTVIAEGVETEAQRDFLDDQGCPSYQGYLFSKPLPLQEFEALI